MSRAANIITFRRAQRQYDAQEAPMGCDHDEEYFNEESGDCSMCMKEADMEAEYYADMGDEE